MLLGRNFEALRRLQWRWNRLDFKLRLCGRLAPGVLDSEPRKSRWNREIREPRESRTDLKRRSLRPAGERPCPLNSFSFRVFRVFRGLNCRFEAERPVFLY